MFISRRVIIAVIMVFMFMILGLGAAVFIALSEASDLGLRISANQIANTKALCALRDNKVVDVQAGNAFLAKHPRGISGIPAGIIKANVANEQDTVKALSIVSCPKPKGKKTP